MSGDQQVLMAPELKNTTNNSELEEQKVGFWWRFLAGAIDSALLGLVYLCIFLLFGSGLSLEGTFALAYFTNIFLSLVYFTYCYATNGQTVGKRLLKIRVVSIDEEPLNFATGIIRYIGYYLSALLFLIGFLMIPFTKDKQGIHDKLAGTYVIRVDSKKEVNKEGQNEG